MIFLVAVCVALTYGAVGCRPARQTFTVTVPGVTRGVVDTVNTDFRTEFAIVASWTHCKKTTIKVIEDVYI